MQINSILKYNQYNRHRELNNEYKNKRKIQESEQGISFAETIEKIKCSIYKDRKNGEEMPYDLKNFVYRTEQKL